MNRFLNFQISFISLFFGVHCTTYDFIPDPDFQQQFPGYEKKNYNEIEIRSNRPEKPYKLMGEMKIREFSESDKENELLQLKKELFRLQMDGIWLEKSKSNRISGMQVNTLNAYREPQSSIELEEEIRYRMGYPFRYKMERK